jgi:hypothetical protein
MADTLTGCPAHDAAAPVPEYPMPWAAECPLAPPPALETLRAEKPITKASATTTTIPAFRT